MGCGLLKSPRARRFPTHCGPLVGPRARFGNADRRADLAPASTCTPSTMGSFLWKTSGGMTLVTPGTVASNSTAFFFSTCSTCPRNLPAGIGVDSMNVDAQEAEQEQEAGEEAGQEVQRLPGLGVHHQADPPAPRARAQQGRQVPHPRVPQRAAGEQVHNRTRRSGTGARRGGSRGRGRGGGKGRRGRGPPGPPSRRRGAPPGRAVRGSRGILPLRGGFAAPSAVRPERQRRRGSPRRAAPPARPGERDGRWAMADGRGPLRRARAGR